MSENLHIDAWLIPPENISHAKRVADRRRHAMRLSALFEEFLAFLRVEKEAAHKTVSTYRWCFFSDFMVFSRKRVGDTVLVKDFTSELCRAYQYDLAARGLQTNTIRVRLATIGSFGKWAVRHDKLERNPLDRITRPKRKKRLPAVPRWEAVEELLKCSRLRNRAILALLAYGGLRRSEVVSLDVGDYLPEFGLRRVQGKGGHEAAVPLPEVARAILSEYLAQERPGAAPHEPLFVVRFKTKGKGWREDRMRDHRVFKLVKALGAGAGIPQLHPHAFRHSCGVELLRRTKGNLRAVQEHLRHQDIQTTTIYTRLTQHELSQVVSVFDRNGEKGVLVPSPRD